VAELRGRNHIEQNFAAQLAPLSETEREMIAPFLGNPPDVDNVPESVWDKIQANRRAALFIILMGVFLTSARQHGYSGQQAELVAHEWASERADELATEYVETSKELLGKRLAAGAEEQAAREAEAAGDVESKVATVDAKCRSTCRSRRHPDGPCPFCRRLSDMWTNMLQRCFNPKCPTFKRYGARGITVCDEWRRDFKAFRLWALLNGYRDGLEIDRRDNLKSYSSDNCRFVTRQENCCNSHSWTGTSRFKGVHWSEKDKRWIAQIRRDRKGTRLGWFIDEEAAARAYDAAARRLHGEFAVCNFPEVLSR
jgi:AP2 domain